ncbi:hypothetical protein [Rhodopirellula sallentina]|uniref:Signal peptide protein n=1 Tax=Rhodopirellula sallentina SM41 TaxID=1263870 RepID=M5U4F0_9BACT|nr:hypothetical protein [Rhodopirellula sallentina]EMI52721.1 signal peptide protein [Rhodopirellula sallentina SM41]
MRWRARFLRAASFSLVIAVLSIVWLVLLPAYARQPKMRQHLQWLDEKGIDPSAMYYTELEIMDEILAKQRRAELRLVPHES